MEIGYTLAGGLVGFMVGLTGVGGGALMTPLLILLFGFSPSVAVGTDLWFAAITKSVGGGMHNRFGAPDWQVIRRLATGSVPAAIVTLAWLGLSHGGRLEANLLMKLLGGALLATSLIMPIKDSLTAPLRKLRHQIRPALRQRQAAATIVSGMLVGCLVSLTSVGAGALVAVILLFLYPIRLDAKSVVSSDIIHAVPLALVAALGHSWLGNVNWSLLLQLILGSIPGIILGSFLANRINEGVIRVALALMLAASGIRLLSA